MDLENRIIEFIDKDSPKLALITKEQGGKAQIVDENGRQSKLNVKLIQVVHGPSNATEFKAAAGSVKDQVGQICEELDTELLWEELVNSDNEGTSAEDLADLYFGTVDSLKISAVFRKLYADQLRFKFKNSLFTARSLDEIEAERAIREKKAAQERQLRDLRKFIRQVHQTPELLDVPEELASIVDQLEAGFAKEHYNDAFSLVEQLEFDQSVEELAFDILVKTGRLSPGSDEILKVVGLRRDFPEQVVEYANSVGPFDDYVGREDFCNLLSFSIDDDDTREVDDAITVEEVDGVIRVGIHIADLACFVKPGDPVDEEALRRSATIYMPTGPVLMVPEHISCGLASLNQGELRPTFSSIIDFATNGEIKDFNICRGKLKVRHRLNYEQADAMMAFPGDDLGRWLSRLSDLCAVNTEKRLKNGSIIFSKHEHKIRVQDDEISATSFMTDTPSRNLISELMILCNSLTAEFAKKNDIPLIFRAQVPPDEPARRYQGKVVKDTNPNVFRGLKKGRLSLHPQTHAGLGIDAYTQVSSPLRRFGDLVMQRQIEAFLNGDDYPYEASELLEVLGNSEAVERDGKAVERRSTRYWELEYIKRLGVDEMDATVMSKVPGAYIVAASPIPVRGKLSVSDEHFRFGQKIRVGIDKILPELSVFRLTYVGTEKDTR